MYKKKFFSVLILLSLISSYVFAEKGSSVNLAKELAQQTIIVKGTVTSEDNEPLPGVTIVIKGTTKGDI